MRGVDTRALATILLFTTALSAAEAPVQRHLTLAEAEALALSNHPRLGAARYRADAAAATVAQARAAYYPTVNIQVTGWGPTTALWWRLAQSPHRVWPAAPPPDSPSTS